MLVCRSPAAGLSRASPPLFRFPEATVTIAYPINRMILKRLFTTLLASACLAVGAAETPSYPPTKFHDPSGWGRNIQRTMRLLATSTAEKRNPVRILFYGQSITEQGWAKLVEEDLRKRFPHANLVVENRALGGFASQMLVKTAETDLYPFQPDLLIFHVYGAHNTYEDIIRRTRERTTAEILMQNDHVNKPADLTEETDPAKVPIQSGKWDAFITIICRRWRRSMARSCATNARCGRPISPRTNWSQARS